MTLMPVSNISVLDSSWSKAGALRWMPQRSLTSNSSPSSRLRHSPSALNTWPLVTSPTGTEIGPPVSRTSAPRTRPSVGWSEMARTMPSPMCWATSSERTRVSPSSSRSTSSLLYISGMLSTGNSTSTTGPITRAIRPTAVEPPSVLVSSTVAVMFFSLTPGLGVGERVHATDNLADFLGNTRLAGLVGGPRVLLDQFVGVVRGGLHRLLTSGELGGRRLQQREEDAALDVLRKQPVEHLLRGRLELVERQHLVGLRRLGALDDLERQQPDVARLLHEHRAELREDHVHLVDTRWDLAVLAVVLDGAGLGLVVEEGADQAVPDLLGHLEVGLVAVTRPRLDDRTVAEPEESLTLASGDIGVDLLAVVLEPRAAALGVLE